FVASLIDAFPEHQAGALSAAEFVAGVPCRLVPHHDNVLTGTRFTVQADVADGTQAADKHPGHSHEHGGSDAHLHTTWSDIRARIEVAQVPAGVRRHALAIFGDLAEAEPRVHGVPVNAVSFHEVGGADSIADVIGAAWLIDALSPTNWSVGPLPMGSGKVQ